MHTVLVGGGGGFIGKLLCQALRELNYNVIIISRQEGMGQITWKKLSQEGLPTCNAVINLAGELLFNLRERFTEDFRVRVLRSRTETNRILTTAMEQATSKPRIWISSSATSFYPFSESINERFTENHKTQADSIFGNFCQEWEDSSRLSSSTEIRHCIVRIGLALSMESGLLPTSYKPAYFGAGNWFSPGTQAFPWIHIRDLIGMFLYLLNSETASGVFNGVAPAQTTNYQYNLAICRAIRRPCWLPIPVYICKKLFGPERAELIYKGQYVVPERIINLGYNFQYPNIDLACKDLIT